MVSTKATVRKVLDNLPDDCTFHQVMDRLSYIEAIQRRLTLASREDAVTVSQEDIERKVARWLSPSDG